MPGDDFGEGQGYDWGHPHRPPPENQLRRPYVHRARNGYASANGYVVTVDSKRSVHPGGFVSMPGGRRHHRNKTAGCDVD